MATLLRKGRRRCCAQCYNAKGDNCKCICGGKNHKVGLEQAVENVHEMLGRHDESDPEPGTPTPEPIEVPVAVQLKLF